MTLSAMQLLLLLAAANACGVMEMVVASSAFRAGKGIGLELSALCGLRLCESFR